MAMKWVFMMPDSDISDLLRSMIRDDVVLSDDAKNVTITVNNGVVTLTGMVRNQAEKDIINAKASAMPSVVRVENNLEVKEAAMPETTPGSTP